MYNEIKLINKDCLPILMFLCIMLYIMLACLMLFSALLNAVCLHNAYLFSAIDVCKCLLHHALSLSYWHIF